MAHQVAIAERGHRVGDLEMHTCAHLHDVQGAPTHVWFVVHGDANQARARAVVGRQLVDEIEVLLNVRHIVDSVRARLPSLTVPVLCPCLGRCTGLIPAARVLT